MALIATRAFPIMPHLVIVQNLDLAVASPARIRVCDSFGSRLRGLMFRRQLAPDHGLLLVGNRDVRLDSAIHMLFVPFQLGVIWINGAMEVVDKVIAKPWRLAYVPARPARFVLEVHPSQYGAYEIGHKVKIVDA